MTSPAVGLRQVLDHRDLVARSRRLAKVELHHDAALGQLNLLDLVERLDAALHLRRLGGVGAETIDEALLLGEHRLLSRVGGLAVGLAQRALAFVEIVVAGVDGDLAAVDLGDFGHDPVHELAIVRGHQQRAGVALEKVLEPDDRLDVEVVGRLVHQQHVGIAEQHARHGDAHLPSARQRAHVAIDLVVVEAEAVEHFARLAFERVAAEMVVFLLHDAKAREDPVDVIGPRRIGHRVLQLLELVMQVAKAAAAGNRLVEHRAAGHLFDVLAEVADGQLLRDRHLALIRCFLAGDHAEDGGLAGAVGADEADLLALLQRCGSFDEEDLVADLLGDVIETDHCCLGKNELAASYSMWRVSGSPFNRMERPPARALPRRKDGQYFRPYSFGDSPCKPYCSIWVRLPPASASQSSRLSTAACAPP